MNYIKQVCEMLGLEWDDEKQESNYFNIVGYDPIYLFTSKGLFYYRCSEKYKSEILDGLLTGREKISKSSWKPNEGDGYYFVDITEVDLYGYCNWCDSDDGDIHRRKHGLIFKTKEDAIDRANEILKLIK
jgi:hypothetical protein